MVNRDKITSDERMKLLIEGKKIDRIPVIPHIETFAGKIFGVGSKEYYLDPTKAYECQVKCKELFNHDGGIDYNIANGYVKDFEGGELEFSQKLKWGYPKVIKRAVTCEADIANLKMPKLLDSFTGKKYSQFNKLSLKNQGVVSLFAGSPTMMAANIVDMEILLKWMIKKPECAHEIMRFSTDYIILMATEYVKTYGRENIDAGMSLPVESNNVMSTKVFEKFALPYIIEVFEKFEDLGINISSIHLCGNHKKNIQYWKHNIKLKPRTLITVGAEMDLKELSKEIGNDYIIGGNLKNTTLQTGTPQDVYKEAEEIIQSMKFFEGGFILTPDCTLSYLTPVENLHAMINAAKKLGQY